MCVSRRMRELSPSTPFPFGQCGLTCMVYSMVTLIVADYLGFITK
jgi:hypothetical protein